jgi:HlyD family secretion protein
MPHLHLSRRQLTAGMLGAIAMLIVAWMLRPKVLDVDAGVVRRGAMRVTVDQEGRTRVRDRFVVTAPVSGRLRRIALDEGDTVSEGQVLLRLAPLPIDESTRQQAEARLTAARAIEHEASIRLADARAAETNARRAADRREVVFAAGGISQEERDAAALAWESRRNERSAAEARSRAAAADVASVRAVLLSLGGGTGAEVDVRAPIAGTVLRIPEPSERVVAAGTPLLELGDPRRIEIVTDVLSADAVRIHVGDEASVAEWGGEAELAARVRAIEPSAFTRVSALGVDEQRVNVVLALVDPPPMLRDGFRVEARIVVWQRPDVVMTPSSALFQRDGEWAVFVATDRRARLRSVSIGQRTSAEVEITRGLVPGDTVILFPSDELADGVRVRAKPF